MIQLQAGYILDCVKETLETKYKPTEVQGLLTQLSYFDLDVNSTAEIKDNSNFEQILSVILFFLMIRLPPRSTPSSSQTFADLIQHDSARWARQVMSAGMVVP